MANAYSILHNYDRPLYTPNYDLINTVMQYKQGKLNANRQRLQTVYDQLSVIDVAKEADKDYANRRLEVAKGIANKYASLDLSSNNLANDLIGKLTEVVDDKVKNAVLSTKIYRAEKAVWDKKRIEKPDEYSEDNYQYAMRGANAWLNDGEVGTKYNGGGDFIAYDNYDKRLQDNIDNISKQLKATWVVQENGVGMFIDNVTKEAVDRGRLEQALDAFIGDKGRQQMMREAWNRGRNIDDESVRMAYEAQYGKAVQESDYMITNLEQMVEKERNPKKRDELQSQLDQWKERKGGLNANSFENVGKESAYYSLYSDNVKAKYLDAYSYGPLTIKREVDQNHVKTIEFQEKVREFELEYQIKLENLQLSKDKFKLEQIKAGVDPNTGLPIQAEGLIPSDKKLINEEGGYTDIKLTEQEKKDFDNAVKELQKIIPNIGETSLTQLAEQVTDKDIASHQIKEYNIGGRKIKLDFSKPEVRNAIINFDKKVVNISPEVKKLQEQIGGMKGEVVEKLLKEMSVNPEFNDLFPAFNQMIIGNSKTGFKVVNTDFDAYKSVLYKINKNGGGMKGYNKLSEGEKLSLDLFVYNQMIMDPETTSPMKRQMFNKMRRDLVSKIGYDNFRKLPATLGQVLTNDVTVKSKWGVYYFDNADEVGGGTVGGGAFLSNLGWLDSESGGASMESVFEDGLDVLSRSYDINLAKSSMAPSNTIFEVTSSDYRFKALNAAIGQANNKNNVAIEFEMGADGKPTGRIKYQYTYWDSKKQKNVPQDGWIEKEKAEALGFKHSEELKYDYRGTDGRNAHTFDLGGVHDSEVDTKTKERFVNQYGQLMPMDDPETVKGILQVAQSTNDPVLYKKVIDEMNAFHNDPGHVQVKLAAKDEDGMYHLDLTTASGGRYSTPVAPGFSTNEVGNFMYNESLYMKHAIFTQYLNNLVNNESAKAAIRASQLELQNLLSK